MTTNDPALAAALEIILCDTVIPNHERFNPQGARASHTDELATIIRRHYAPLQQQLIGANVELAELRRTNEIRTKSQKQLQAEIATNTETILHLQAELFKSRGECERLWHLVETAETLLYEAHTCERSENWIDTANRWYIARAALEGRDD